MVDQTVEKKEEDSVDKRAAGFLFYVTAVSIVAGFGLTVAKARKSFPADLQSHYNDGSRLATKALAYGTLLSVSGCGLLVFTVSKLLGVNTVRFILLFLLQILILYFYYSR